MKTCLIPAITLFLSTGLFAQQQDFSIQQIKLPPELSYYDNQFSGLQVAHEKLYLLSESRLEDKRETKIYTLKLADIERSLRDTNYILPFQKVRINGLERLADRMKKDGQVYEGLEAFIIDNETIYFSVETNTPSPFCYILKGKFENGHIQLDQTLQAIRKPRKQTGESIYNAGFESMALIKNRLYGFYEYNYFEINYVYCFDKSVKGNKTDSLPIEKLPFRITDITPAGNNHYTAINFFYEGAGDDEVYRVPASDTANNKLIKTGDTYHAYCRLVDIELTNKHFTWKPVWVFPKEYTGFNWEGIAKYKNGYFVMNDKYTLARPYASVLLYLQEK